METYRRPAYLKPKAILLREVEVSIHSSLNPPLTSGAFRLQRRAPRRAREVMQPLPQRGQETPQREVRSFSWEIYRSSKGFNESFDRSHGWFIYTSLVVFLGEFSRCYNDVSCYFIAACGVWSSTLMLIGALLLFAPCFIFFPFFVGGLFIKYCVVIEPFLSRFHPLWAASSFLGCTLTCGFSVSCPTNHGLERPQMVRARIEFASQVTGV